MQLTIILVEPEHPGNTGAIARAMKNFDCKNLILIRPLFKRDNEELRNRAKWANDVIDNAVILKGKTGTNTTLKNLRKKFDYLIATTAIIGRDYHIARSPITPEQLALRIAEINPRSKTKIGILIGRESSGLTNDELAIADFTVTIPASKDYGTMNISHATTIILYELFKKTNSEHLTSHITPISGREKEQILKILNMQLKKMSFATPEKRETQRLVWKKLIAKGFLSKREAYALMGFLKKIK
ncbi:MAG: TrmJ/YjtD family RNA methyltransferase [Candidatus Woesearchaeota archaeon]